MTLGRDCRLSSPRIHAAFKRELLAAGHRRRRRRRSCTRPALYFSVFHLGADGGVMITASHNPAEDNGFKIVCGKSTIYGAEIQKLRERIETRAFRTGAAPGRASEHDILADYVAYIAEQHQAGPAPVQGRRRRRQRHRRHRGAADPRRSSASTSRRSTATPTAASPTTTPIRPSPRTSPISSRACGRPAPRWGSRSTATPIGSAPSTARGGSSGATSWSCCSRATS